MTHLVTDNPQNNTENMLNLDGKFQLADCIWAVVHRCEDGYIGCPLLDSGNWTCDECIDILSDRIEREERQ